MCAQSLIFLLEFILGKCPSIYFSFIGAIGWSIAFGLLYFIISRYKRGAWVVGLCVISHWLLDAIVHRPDLLLAPGSNIFIGLGL